MNWECKKLHSFLFYVVVGIERREDRKRIIDKYVYSVKEYEIKVKLIGDDDGGGEGYK